MARGQNSLKIIKWSVYYPGQLRLISSGHRPREEIDLLSHKTSPGELEYHIEWSKNI